MCQRLTFTEPAWRLVLKERNPWNTLTGSCESDETEYEEVMQFRVPPGLPDTLTEETNILESRFGCQIYVTALIEEARIRESRFGGQIDVTAKADGRLHPRYKHMKDARPFKKIVSDKSSSELSEQKRLSILSWNAGPKRGKIANSMVGSFHVILVQEAQTQHHDIARSVEQQFHVYQGADQLIRYIINTF